MASPATDLSSATDGVHFHHEQDIGERSDVTLGLHERMKQAASPSDFQHDVEPISEMTSTPYEVPTFLAVPKVRARHSEHESPSRPSPKTLFDGDGIAMDSFTSGSSQPLPESYELSRRPLPVSSPPPTTNFVEPESGKAALISEPSVGLSRTPSLNYEVTEESRPSPQQLVRYRRYARLHFMAICWCFFLQGWNDGTTGPLLPRMQSVYNVRCASTILLVPRSY